MCMIVATAVSSDRSWCAGDSHLDSIASLFADWVEVSREKEDDGRDEGSNGARARLDER